jgi:hypothetical protein
MLPEPGAEISAANLYATLYSVPDAPNRASGPDPKGI